MLAQLIKTFRHLLTPRHTNNHRPKILYPSSLSILAAVVILANSGIQTFAQVRGGVLGYASDITLTQVLDQTNQRRINAGLNPLILNEQLSDAARRKATDMFNYDYWAHTNPINGTSPWYFFDAVDYHYRYAGENLARDFATTPPMVQAWIDSPTHRDNLLSPRYQDTGIAIINGTIEGVETTLVVQFFGTRQQTGVVAQVPSAAINPQPPPALAAINQETTLLPPAQIQNQSSASLNSQPILSPLDISKTVALATLGLIALVIAADAILAWYRKTHRLAGNNWAHLAFITALMILIGSLNAGAIG